MFKFLWARFYRRFARRLTAEAIERQVKKGYQKALSGDWSAFDEIEFLNHVDTFYLHWALFEVFAFNLKAYLREVEDDETETEEALGE